MEVEKNKDRLCIDVAKLYYQSEFSQQQIAQQMGISRPSVSRLLQYAKEQGYVNIQIIDPVENMEELERRLAQKYGMQEVRVAYSTLNDPGEIKKYIGSKAAEYLNEIARDGDIIGVSWGTTMYNVACRLKSRPLQGAQIVQLKGGVTDGKSTTYADEILEKFAKAFSTIARYLPLPVIFGTKEVKEMVDQDRHIKRILELGRQANIAVFTVGTVKEDALLFRLGYIEAADKVKLQQIAVGDICSRFFDRAGEICNAEIDDRTVGIKLAELRDKERSILVAGGERKVEAIRAALVGQYANVLITDQYTAKALL
ncbi:MAG: sugar-binding transcriptional regulator [Selenomonadaceae bacterium]